MFAELYQRAANTMFSYGDFNLCYIQEQIEDREVMKIVHFADNVPTSHYQVAGMDFIPSGYKALSFIHEHRLKLIIKWM